MKRATRRGKSPGGRQFHGGQIWPLYMNRLSCTTNFCVMEIFLLPPSVSFSTGELFVPLLRLWNRLSGGLHPALRKALQSDSCSSSSLSSWLSSSPSSPLSSSLFDEPDKNPLPLFVVFSVRLAGMALGRSKRSCARVPIRTMGGAR